MTTTFHYGETYWRTEVSYYCVLFRRTIFSCFELDKISYEILVGDEVQYDVSQTILHAIYSKLHFKCGTYRANSSDLLLSFCNIVFIKL